MIVEGVDEAFYCWRRVPSTRPGFEEEFQPCRASEYWHVNYGESKYTEFPYSTYIKPRGIVTVSLRSRQLFTYGSFSIRAILPRVKDGPMLWFGFEADDLFAGGVVHFMWNTGSGILTANVGNLGKVISMDLTKFLPQDASERHHWFSIVYRRGLALWYIDGRLRAIASVANGDVKDGGVVYDKPPYVASWTTDAPSPQLAVLLDIDGAPNVEFQWLGLNPWGLRVSNGDAEGPVRLRLYRDGSEEAWAGLTVNPGDELVSQPLPGLGKKTIMLKAPSGVVRVEGLVGGEWVELVSTGAQQVFAISQDAPLIRIIYRANEAGSIKASEFILT